jgi:hypothetical protein
MHEASRDSAIEQGWFLCELRERFGLSCEELARRFDRSVSWVSRRLGLVRQLPEALQDCVRQGRIVAHAAMKYLLPMARANREDCLRLMDKIGASRLSSRQIGRLYAAYSAATAEGRELVLSDPLVCLRVEEQRRETPRKLTSSEELLKDLKVIGAVARRADHRVRVGVESLLSGVEREQARYLFKRARADIESFALNFEKEFSHAGRIRARDDLEAPRAGGEFASDRADAARFTRGGARRAELGHDEAAHDREDGTRRALSG